MAIGCAEDEYNGEAALIENKIAKASDFGKIPLQADQVERFVEEVWADQFGPFTKEELDKRRNAFSSAASKIVV